MNHRKTNYKLALGITLSDAKKQTRRIYGRLPAPGKSYFVSREVVSRKAYEIWIVNKRGKFSLEVDIHFLV